MATNPMGIQTGMTVLDPAGEKVGTVADILQVQAFSQATASGGYASPTVDTGTTAYGSGAASSAAGEGSIIKVDQGGILGIGAKELYIPFGDVTNVVPNENLTVKCTKDMCADRYGNKPEFLGKNT